MAHGQVFMFHRERFVLPQAERRRLHLKAHLAQRKDGHAEVAGVLVADGRYRLRLVFLTNEAAPGSFTLSKSKLSHAKRRARELGLRFVGYFHSHPLSEPTPSEGDLRRAPQRSIHLIYDVCGRKARLWSCTRRAGLRTAVELSMHCRALTYRK